MKQFIWTVGFRDRGMGHGDFAVIVKKNNEVIAQCPNHETAQYIVNLHNESLRKSKTQKQIVKQRVKNIKALHA